MKKFKIAVLLVFTLAMVTACSCSKKEFLVEFDSNGGTKVQSQTIEKGGKVAKPDDPTKDGYSFDKWQLDGKAYDFDLEVTEDLVLVAKWNKKDTKKDEPVANVCTLTCEKGYALNAESCTCYKLTAAKVNVNAEVKYLEQGETFQIKASISPEGVLNTKVTYSVSNSSIASVDANGLVTAKTPGTTVVTVKSEDSGVSTAVTIVVLDDYSYSTSAVDASNISYKVALFKNGQSVSTEECKEISAVYDASGRYLGRYDETLQAIIVDIDQIDEIGIIKVNAITYKVKKAVIG